MASLHRSSHRIAPCLWFAQNEAREAAEFYETVFPDSSVEPPMGLGAGDGAPAGELMVRFTVLGQPIVGINGGPAFELTEAFSLMVQTDDQEETDRYWHALVGNGGAVSRCGWCKDRFGLSWQIVPRMLLQVLAEPDREAAGRAMRALMGMTRIDIEAIEHARLAA